MHRSVTRGAKIYFAANLVAQASALLRYVLLSRLLGPEQLGLAAMLILTAQFFESVTDTAADRFMVQDAKGDTPSMQKTVQLALFGRGTFLAAALVITGVGMGMLNLNPGLGFSVAALAVVPLIGGLVNLDVYRYQRTGDFRAASLSQVVAEVASLIATGIAAYITRDHTAIIYGLAVRGLATVLISQLVAQRRYAWGYSKPEAATFRRFALPLFLNGLLLFLGGQGDRLLVGFLGAAELGKYSAIMLLIYYPANMILRFMSNIHLPEMAAARDDPAAFNAASRRLGGRTLLLSVGMMAGFTLVGPVAAPLLFGQQYAQRADIFALLAALEGARFLRLWPVTVALAEGRTTIAMFDNASRLLALPIAAVAMLMTRSLEAILIGFVIGEYVALLTTLALLTRATHISIAQEAGRLVMLAVCSLLAVGWSLAVPAGHLPSMLALLVASVLTLGQLLRMERSVIVQVLGVARTWLAARRTA